MFILNWYREYLEIRNEAAEKRRELQYCESCETLKLQLSVANEEKKQLLNRVLEKPEKETEAPISENLKPILPRSGMPFNVRRQILEREDRDRVKKLHNNTSSIAEAKRSTALSVAEIEKELEVNDAN